MSVSNLSLIFQLALGNLKNCYYVGNGSISSSDGVICRTANVVKDQVFDNPDAVERADGAQGEDGGQDPVEQSPGKAVIHLRQVHRKFRAFGVQRYDLGMPVS